MTLLEALVDRIQSTPGFPPDSVYGVEDDDAKDTCVLVTPYQGFKDAGAPVFRQPMNIQSRGRKYQEAEALSWRAYQRLEGFMPKGTDEHIHTMPIPNQPPSYVGQDDKGRYVFSFNFTYITTRKSYLERS